MLLAGKVLIVSGIGPGLGVKLAIEAAREGAAGLAISARTAGKLDDAERRIGEVNAGCAVLKQVTDIRDAAQCRRLAEATVERFGRIDALLNSAFFWGAPASVEAADVEGWKEVYDTNVLGTMRMTQAVVPAMKARGGGAVVNVSTMATIKPHVGEAGYAASKGGLNVVSRYLATELGPHGIRVNVVRMGWMYGEPVQHYIRHAAKQQGVPEQQVYDSIAARVPLRRLVTDDECARAALFLASDHASAVTGAVLDANGGEAMAG